jgi:hypothetical protein
LGQGYLKSVTRVVAFTASQCFETEQTEKWRPSGISPSHADSLERGADTAAQCSGNSCRTPHLDRLYQAQSLKRCCRLCKLPLLHASAIHIRNIPGLLHEAGLLAGLTARCILRRNSQKVPTQSRATLNKIAHRCGPRCNDLLL